MNIFFENKLKDYLKFRGKSSFLHSKEDMVNIPRYFANYIVNL